MNTVRKLLVLDAISELPLGRELTGVFQGAGVDAVHFDCLRQPQKPLYALRSAWAKLKNRAERRDAFHFLPKIPETRLQRLIVREQPSHILVVGFIYKFFDPAALRRLADAAKARLFLYDTDTCNLYRRRREFIFFIERELSAYDHIFSCSLVTTRFFRETRRLSVDFLPFGATPIHCGQAGEKPLDVLFVGSSDLRRIFLLEGIRDHVTVFGNRWRRNAPLISEALWRHVEDQPIWGEALHQKLAQAKIILNITRADFYGAETGINLRIFEALAAGAFLLTDHCDELAALFRIGEEIETYRSAAELAEKVRYYLAHPDARERIARNGHAAFRESHTWNRRAEEMLATMRRKAGAESVAEQAAGRSAV